MEGAGGRAVAAVASPGRAVVADRAASSFCVRASGRAATSGVSIGSAAIGVASRPPQPASVKVAKSMTGSLDRIAA